MQLRNPHLLGAEAKYGIIFKTLFSLTSPYLKNNKKKKKQ